MAKIAIEKAGILKRSVPCVVGPQPNEALEVIEAHASQLGVPLLTYGQQWHVFEERGRLVYQDETGLLDLPIPNLIGTHQVLNAGVAIAALRHLGFDETAYEAAVTNAEWPARMQKLRRGPLVEAAPQAELWLDGGHNASAGQALAQTVKSLPPRPLHIICGMLNTKDIGGYLEPLSPLAETFQGVSIPGEAATLSAQETVQAGLAAGFNAREASDVLAALRNVVALDSQARILICGSLYLAGAVLRENG